MRNPVVWREVLTTFRSPRSLVLLLLPALMTSLLVLLRWPSEAVVAQTGNRSLELFSLFGGGLVTLVCLLTPASPAVSLVKERNRGTLQLLLNSPLSRGSLYVGKLIGATILIGVALVMTFPAAAACFALGGITFTRHLIPLYGILLVAGLQLAAISLLISSHARNIDSAVRAGYGAMLLVVVGVLGPYQLWQGSDDPFRVQWADRLRHLSPLPALMEIIGQGDVAGQGLVGSGGGVTKYLICGGLSIVLAALATIFRLHPRMFDESRDSGIMTDDRSLAQRSFRRLFFLVDPQRRSWSIGNWTNPVLIKEFRCRKFGRATWLLRLIALCAVASVAMTYFAATGVKDWSVELIGGLLILLQMALILLLAPGLSAGLLAGEHESGGWALLRMTPLSPRRIVVGKLLSVVWTMLLVMLATLPGYLVMIYLKPVLKPQVLQVVSSLVLASLFALSMSAAVGGFFRRSIPATMASYSVLTALTAVPLLIWMGRDAPFGFRVVESALLLSPISSALSLMGTQGFEHYRLVPGNWYFLSAGVVVGLVVFWGQARRSCRPD